MASATHEQLPYVFLMVIGSRAPDEADWDAAMATIEAGNRNGAPPRALVISEGGAPSPAQRARLGASTAPSGDHLKVAVMSSSTFVRGVLTAMSLVHRGYRVFSPERLDEALAHLDVRAHHAEEVRAVITRLRARIG